MTGFDAAEFTRLVDAAAHVIAARDIATERARTNMWMAMGRKYEDILFQLRMSPNTPEGHAEFYRGCARLIFGEEEYDRVFLDDEDAKEGPTG